MSSLTRRLDSDPRFYLRWTPNERAQHWILVATFLVLAVTGFALRYPGAWWVRPWTGHEWLFDLRGLLHRVAGGVFLVLGAYHLLYVSRNERGRSLRRSMRPGLEDLADVVRNVSWFLGLRTDPPRFGRFSYVEKLEYLALVWGAGIMGLTGLMLWFEETTISLLARWVIDLATVIHLYEAWLACLAVLVWHIYSVVVSPEVYPLDTSMIDGRISEGDLENRHPLECLEDAEGETAGREGGEDRQGEDKGEEKERNGEDPRPGA